ncbi:hypothetical protein C8R43DRAFT_1035999 [Mycena crocata]|nr:hypothetical protein C8R43DRAFT_1035999 [Mycena crocata]
MSSPVIGPCLVALLTTPQLHGRLDLFSGRAPGARANFTTDVGFNMNLDPCGVCPIPDRARSHPVQFSILFNEHKHFRRQAHRVRSSQT